jgi:hypothetical protein
MIAKPFSNFSFVFSASVTIVKIVETSERISWFIELE